MKHQIMDCERSQNGFIAAGEERRGKENISGKISGLEKLSEMAP